MAFVHSHYWLFIYSGGETGHNDNFYKFYLTLEAKIDQKSGCMRRLSGRNSSVYLLNADIYLAGSPTTCLFDVNATLAHVGFSAHLDQSQ